MSEQNSKTGWGIWNVDPHYRGLYFTIFVLLMAAATWISCVESSKFFTKWQNVSSLTLASAAYALIITELVRVGKVIAWYLENWLHNRRRARLLKERAEAFDEGKEEGIRETMKRFGLQDPPHAEDDIDYGEMPNGNTTPPLEE